MLAGMAAGPQVILYFVLGTLGSLLPDMDSERSLPVRFAFTLASILLAFVAMFRFAEQFPSVGELVLIWLAAFLFFRWSVFWLLETFTVHRGLFHSLPAALLAGLLGVTACFHGLGLSALESWLGGVFVCFGYLVHLLLDEVYSVNLFGARPRRSLGTAFKLGRLDQLPATLLLYLLLPLAWLVTPTAEPFLERASDPAVYNQINQRLLPAEGWFAGREAAPELLEGLRVGAQRLLGGRDGS
jgi:hypothetical protein